MMHHSSLALGMIMLFLIFIVIVDIAAGIWGLSEEERRQNMLFNAEVCMCLRTCSAFKAVLLMPVVFWLEKNG